jgi:hypothetical protein
MFIYHFLLSPDWPGSSPTRPVTFLSLPGGEHLS